MAGQLWKSTKLVDLLETTIRPTVLAEDLVLVVLRVDVVVSEFVGVLQPLDRQYVFPVALAGVVRLPLDPQRVIHGILESLVSPRLSPTVVICPSSPT